MKMCSLIIIFFLVVLLIGRPSLFLGGMICLLALLVLLAIVSLIRRALIFSQFSFRKSQFSPSFFKSPYQTLINSEDNMKEENVSEVVTAVVNEDSPTPVVESTPEVADETTQPIPAETPNVNESAPIEEAEQATGSAEAPQEENRVPLVTVEPLIDSLATDLKSSFADLQTQIANVLDERIKVIGSFIDFEREQMNVRARNNLRIRRLMDVYRLIWGNLNFVTESLVERSGDEILLSLQRRLSYLSKEFQKILNDDNMRVIAPLRNDELNEEEHEIQGEISRKNEDDQSGHIAYTRSIGFSIEGSIEPAKVYLYE